MTKPITLRELAKLANTSASTVSRVLSRDPRISKTTRDRVQAVLKEHPYRPNSFAQALKGGRTGLIGVLSSSIGSGFMPKCFRASTESAGSEIPI